MIPLSPSNIPSFAVSPPAQHTAAATVHQPPPARAPSGPGVGLHLEAEVEHELGVRVPGLGGHVQHRQRLVQHCHLRCARYSGVEMVRIVE